MLKAVKYIRGDETTDWRSLCCFSYISLVVSDRNQFRAGLANVKFLMRTEGISSNLMAERSWSGKGEWTHTKDLEMLPFYLFPCPSSHSPSSASK